MMVSIEPGEKTSLCRKRQPLCKSHGDVGDLYGVGETCRVMAAIVIWTRGCKDRPGAQMAYFASPPHSPLLHQEEQPAFWWEESPLQQHQSSLRLHHTAVKEESPTLSPGAFALSHCPPSPGQSNHQPGAAFPAAAARELPDHD